MRSKRNHDIHAAVDETAACSPCLCVAVIYDDDIGITHNLGEKQMRTIVDLPDEQIEALKRLSNDTRLSRAELERRAVIEFLARRRLESPGRAFGLWKARPKDALSVQEALRSEWSDEGTV